MRRKFERPRDRASGHLAARGEAARQGPHGIVRSVLSARAPLSHERQDMAEFRSSGRYLAPALVACAAAAAPHAGAPRAAELTIDRLFDAPALAGPTIVGLAHIARRLARDLLARQGRRQRPARSVGLRSQGRGTHVCWSTREPLPRSMRSSPTRRSAAASASGPRPSPGSSSIPSRLRDAPCCFPSTASSTTTTWRSRPRSAVLALTPPDAFATDATISPRGGYVAYVRDQNLHVYDLAAQRRPGADPGWRRHDQERPGGIRRAGRDGPQQRLLVGTR